MRTERSDSVSTEYVNRYRLFDVVARPQHPRAASPHVVELVAEVGYGTPAAVSPSLLFLQQRQFEFKVIHHIPFILVAT